MPRRMRLLQSRSQSHYDLRQQFPRMLERVDRLSMSVSAAGILGRQCKITNGPLEFVALFEV